MGNIQIARGVPTIPHSYHVPTSTQGIRFVPTNTTVHKNRVQLFKLYQCLLGNKVSTKILPLLIWDLCVHAAAFCLLKLVCCLAYGNVFILIHAFCNVDVRWWLYVLHNVTISSAVKNERRQNE